MRAADLMADAARRFEKGDHSGAYRLCRRILGDEPGHVGALGMLGVLAGMAGDMKQAAALLGRALERDPGNPALIGNLARALASDGKMAAAAGYYAKLVALQPRSASAHYDLACAHQQLGNMEEAEAGFRRAVALEPGNVPALTNLAALLRDTARPEEAVACYRAAVERAPGLCVARTGLGLALQEAGLLDEARQALLAAVEACPDDADAHLNLATSYLLAGDYGRGWPEYEWRWKRAAKQPRDYSFPRWQGEALAGKTVLAFAEQGIGDEIMFASCLPDLLEQAGTLIIDCEPRLAPLFSRSFPGAVVHGGYQNEAGGWLAGLRPVDVQVPVGSLPLYLRGSRGSFPRRDAYLVPDGRARDDWRQRLEGLGGGMKVGISWKGGGTLLARRQRSLDPGALAGMLQQRDMHVVNLQYGDCREELQRWERDGGCPVHSLPGCDPLADIDGFAALIAALDLVITVDNSTAHLAGALGVTTWLLLPSVPDWRWLASGSGSPWYSSVRLFRAPAAMQWEAPLGEIARELDRLLETRGIAGGETGQRS